MKNWLSFIVAIIALVVSLILVVSLGNLTRDVRDISDKVASMEKAIPGSVAPLEEKVARLEEGLGKLDALSASLGEVQARLEALEGLQKEFKSLVQSVGGMDENLQRVDGEIADLQGRVATVEAFLGELKNLREEISSMLEEETRGLSQEFAEQLARLEKELQNERARLEALEKLSIDERFSALLQYVDRKIGELQEQFKGLEIRLEETMQAQLQGVSQELLLLEKELETEKARREALEELRKEVEDAVAFLRKYVDEKIKEFEKAIENSKDQVENLRGEMLFALEEKVQALQKKFQEVEKKIRNLSVDERFSALLGYLEGKLKELRSAFEEIQARAVTKRDLEETLQAFEEKLRAIEEEIRKSGKDFEKRLGEFEKEKVVVLEGKVGELSVSLTSFETAFQKTQETLRTVVEQLNILKGQLLSLEENVDVWREDMLQSFRKEIEALPTSQDLEEIRQELDALFAEREDLRFKLQEALAEHERIVKEIGEKERDIALLREVMQKTTGPELENLRKQLETLASVQKDLEGALRRTEEEIRVLRETLQAKDKEMETMLSGITQDVQMLFERLEGLGKRFEELGALVPLKEALGILENRLAEIEKFSKDVLKKDLEARMQSLEGVIATLRMEIGRIAEEFRVSSANWQNVLELLKGLEESKASLERRVQEIYELIEGKEKKEEVAKDVESLLKQKEALRLEIEGLARERMGLESELERRKRELADIEKNLARLHAEKGSVEQIQKLEEAKKEAEREIRELQEALEAKDAQIANLQQRNEELTLQLEETKKFTSYVILPWDSLWKIARRYYRDGRKWTVIWEANRDKIPDPERLQPYVEIRIPRVPESTFAK